MQCFIRNLLIRILLGIMPVAAYADQKCYGDIIVFQRFDDQAIYPYFAPVSNDKTKKSEVRNKTIIIQKRKQKQDEFLAQKKNEEVHTKEEKKNSENKKQLDAAIAKEILENGEKKWMVQVALAANQNKANKIQSQLEAKGYKVVTSSTTKGIRVMIDPANDYAIAQIIREKIIADNSLNMQSAWVFKWASLTPQ
ncbi:MULTISPECIES: SPOR domain-containing protein [Acinetobacter]|uniref:SPOR domain-containing protein n=1 Tax=Acinetobacter pittii TaxID=48296 RepID=A0AAE9MDC4_ACIPI|nr:MULTISPECIES: SPOR domain-containing protein [Acinetobacter calcoaceticus/baumannii complex]MBK0409944.1 SPOR domain-containing protein [Acinetobacter pittii]MCM5532211.1 SPOR domain-containing protein [Acinetobacter pittii]MCQ9381950.1 SPOR domain-containing protein [Acinetobacter pittii]MCR3925195.1 SPOR domain-containing protein [Acinetobacter pittii]MDP7812205.1 SPOR domain-containing protein [Acinetobacter pittii]